MDKINTINELKELLLSKDKLENSIIVDCNIDVLIIYLRGIKYKKNTIVNIVIDQPNGKHKQAIIRFKDGVTSLFQIKDDLLISKNSNVCIFQSENIEKIKTILNDYRYEHYKNCIKELENINKDYIETIKAIISYDN